jgi:plasmid replication initiation protein
MKQESLPKVFDSKTPKIYKNKKLNTANFSDFTHNDYQVFLHLVSKIGGVDEYGKYLQPEQLQREHLLTAKEFSEVFNNDLSNSYKLLYKACKKLMKTSISVERLEVKEIWEMNICSMAKYNKDNGSIIIEFTDRIMPYLAQVKEKFILYNLKEIANFGSLYTTRLYELLQEFKETGWMIKSVGQLRDIFAVGDKYKFYGHFKTKTFGHACEEINANYNINLSFEEIKEGRKVVAVRFSFNPVKVHKAVNQKTGNLSNIYIKPEAKLKTHKKTNPKQLELLKTKMEDSNDQTLPEESKPIKNILSSLFSKIKSFTK